MSEAALGTQCGACRSESVPPLLTARPQTYSCRHGMAIWAWGARMHASFWHFRSVHGTPGAGRATSATAARQHGSRHPPA
eukprot:4530322-Prymnesium_polylepis.2